MFDPYVSDPNTMYLLQVIAVNAVKITNVIKAGLTSKPDHVQLLKIDILQTIVYKHLGKFVSP